MIDRSLRHHYADYVADTYIKKLIRQVELFGFHTATLDVRQHSQEHENAMTEILAKMNVTPDYSKLSEQEKIVLLEKLLNDPRPLTSLTRITVKGQRSAWRYTVRSMRHRRSTASSVLQAI